VFNPAKDVIAKMKVEEESAAKKFDTADQMDPSGGSESD
jgi:hypothetical protein